MNIALAKKIKTTKNCFMSHDLQDSHLCSKWIYTIIPQTHTRRVFFSFTKPTFQFPPPYSCHGLLAALPCEFNHARDIRTCSPVLQQTTFATLWLLPSFPAFGPGLDTIAPWYRLILRKEDQPSRPSTHRGNLGSKLACLCGYSGPSIRVNILSL